MHLDSAEFDKLVIHMMADVALKRKAKGLKLNYPEAVAVISAAALEGARAGKTMEETAEEAREVPREGRRDGGRSGNGQPGSGRGHVQDRNPAHLGADPDPVSMAGALPGSERSGHHSHLHRGDSQHDDPGEWLLSERADRDQSRPAQVTN